LAASIVFAFAILVYVLKAKNLRRLVLVSAPSMHWLLGTHMASEGGSYAATEARSMMAGAIAFFICASLVIRIMRR